MRNDPALESKGTELNTLRPRNYVRNFFHVFNALLCVALYEWFLTYNQVDVFVIL